MGVHEPEAKGEIVIGFRFDERNLMRVPADAEGCGNRRGFAGQHGEAFRERASAPKIREGDAAQNMCGDAKPAKRHENFPLEGPMLARTSRARERPHETGLLFARFSA